MAAISAGIDKSAFDSNRFLLWPSISLRWHYRLYCLGLVDDKETPRLAGSKGFWRRTLLLEPITRATLSPRLKASDAAEAEVASCGSVLRTMVCNRGRSSRDWWSDDSKTSKSFLITMSRSIRWWRSWWWWIYNSSADLSEALYLFIPPSQAANVLIGR